MGLYIRCKHSEKDISWSYSTLHVIRDLALQTCGINKDVCSIIRSCSRSDVDIIRFILAYHPEVSLDASIFFGFQLAGYYYPNLLFHSDCEGTYTSKGRVMSDANWLHGNIKQLQKELELLLNNSNNINDDVAKSYAKQLLLLVSDELNYKQPEIIFA